MKDSNTRQPALPTLVALLEHRAATSGDKTAFIFLRDGQKDEVAITFAQLAHRAKQIAHTLAPHAAPGERVLINHSPGIEYIASFFGCLYAGVVAVPVYPPRFNAKLDRLTTIAEDATATAALTSSSILGNLAPLLPQSPALERLKWIDTELMPESEAESRAHTTDPTALAFMQYTSGSTSRPKGVMLSHENIMANLDCIQKFFGVSSDDVAMSWLPPYHDMGLIGGILEPIYSGITMVQMSPYAFAQRPIRWLRALTKYHVTFSGGPNFAFDLCVDRIPEDKLSELDLSAWKLAFCGAEPIRAEVLERFTKKFAPCGFRREALYPCYGLAEATLIVTGGQRFAGPVVFHADGDKLQLEGAAAPVTAQSAPARARAIVGCGKAAEGHSVRIVDPDTKKTLPDGKVGEIWFSGPSVAQGYWKRTQESTDTFSARIEGESDGRAYLRTGDLGFLRDGELFITSRIKDLIIVRGRNLYPHDIELSVEKSHVHLRAGAGAAFALNLADEERLVIVHELERNSRDADLDEIIDAIRRQVMEDHGLTPFAISLIQSNTIPLTSSGKIQRHASRDQFLKGELVERKRFTDPTALPV